MPSRCCVTNCKGNYDTGEKVAVFSFPKDDELRKCWINAIPRKDFVPTQASKVCEHHFAEGDVERTTEAYDPTSGKKIVAPLKHPRLHKGAIPSVFPGCPSYLSTDKRKRESMDERRVRLENTFLNEAIAQSLLSKASYDEKVKVISLSELRDKIKTNRINKHWSVINLNGKVLFVLLEIEPCPQMSTSVIVSDTLEANAFHGTVKLKKVGKNTSLPHKVANIHDLFFILEDMEKLCFQPTNADNIDVYVNELKNILEKLENCGEELHVSHIKFFREQIALLFNNNPSKPYGSDLLIFSALIYSISPHAYKFLRSSGNLILPHPSTIRRFYNRYQFSPKNEQDKSGFLQYIRSKVPLLEPNDHVVTLMMDEIHIKSYFDFKGGCVIGSSYDSANPASSAHAFMIQSILSSFKDVVHILPVNKLTAEKLFDVIRDTIIGLERIGFKVVCVVSDNNSINRKAVSHFVCPPKVSIVYPHPNDPSRPLFFAFDSVHLLKCVRNNWINQKSHGQSFFYPEFKFCTDASQINMKTASFCLLKKLHQLEGHDLLQYGHGLSLKALCPTTMERQNVKLALKFLIGKWQKDYKKVDVLKVGLMLAQQLHSSRLSVHGGRS